MTAATNVIARWRGGWRRLVCDGARLWADWSAATGPRLDRCARRLAPRSLPGLGAWLAADVAVLAAVAWGLIGLSQGAEAATRHDFRALAVITAAPTLPVEIRNPRSANGFAEAAVRPTTAPSPGQSWSPTPPQQDAPVTPAAAAVAALPVSHQPTAAPTHAPLEATDARTARDVSAADAAPATLTPAVPAWPAATEALVQPTVQPATATSADPTVIATTTETATVPPTNTAVPPTETLTPMPTRTAAPVILETWTPVLPGAPGWFGAGACTLVEQTGPVGGNPLAWPADSHYLSGYAYSGWHPAIDVAATYGAPIYATDSGVVVYSGWNDTGYGTFLIIDHGDGLWSAYAHLSQTLVGCLQPVVQGQLIGTAGATGYAQGVHLHFELFQIGVGQVNPWSRLP